MVMVRKARPGAVVVFAGALLLAPFFAGAAAPITITVDGQEYRVEPLAGAMAPARIDSFNHDALQNKREGEVRACDLLVDVPGGKGNVAHAGVCSWSDGVAETPVAI